MSTAVTQGIRVTAESRYIPERSKPGTQYFFAYTISIANEGEATAQLRSRHWIITNADGVVEEVQGDGVVGEQPVLKPGEQFEYTSFCVLETPWGSMEGTYRMVPTGGGDPFEAAIAQFRLTLPGSLN